MWMFTWKPCVHSSQSPRGLAVEPRSGPLVKPHLMLIFVNEQPSKDDDVNIDVQTLLFLEHLLHHRHSAGYQTQTFM